MDFIRKLLETYSLEEILEMNDVEPEDAILVLWEQGYIKEVNPLPIDIYE